MKPLELDFAGRRRGIAPLGAALLCAGVLLALLSILRVADVLAAQAEARGDLAALDAAAERGRTRPAAKTALEPRVAARAQATRQVAQALESPWAELLDVIELRPQADVALLSVEPSALKHTVTLTAEARTEQAMLEHLALLQADRRLANVMLVSHQRQLQAPGTPWRYQIQGSW